MDWLWSHSKDLSEFIGLVVVIATGGLWVVRMLIAGRKQWQKVLEGQSAFAENQDKIAKTLNEVVNQLRPNGGTSIFDMAKAAQKKSEENNAQLKVLVDEIQHVKSYQWNFAETVAMKPVWETDASGYCIRVNGLYAKLAERDPAELTGNGWENFILPEDRTRVATSWGEAVERNRNFEEEFRVRSKTGKIYRVKAIAVPLRLPSGKVTSYVGRYEEVVPEH